MNIIDILPINQSEIGAMFTNLAIDRGHHLVPFWRNTPDTKQRTRGKEVGRRVHAEQQLPKPVGLRRGRCGYPVAPLLQGGSRIVATCTGNYKKNGRTVAAVEPWLLFS